MIFNDFKSERGKLCKDKCRAEGPHFQQKRLSAEHIMTSDLKGSPLTLEAAPVIFGVFTKILNLR